LTIIPENHWVGILYDPEHQKYVIKMIELLSVIIIKFVAIKKGDRELLFNGGDKIDFMCGGHTGKLFPEGFALVPTADARYDIQKTFFERFRVSLKFTCEDPIEKTYYTDRLKNTKPICYECGCDLTDNPDIINEIKESQITWSVVLPTCKSRQCGAFKCERKKRPKRPAQGAAPAPKKKRRKRGAGGGR
jgi:hypothetical protein